MAAEPLVVDYLAELLDGRDTFESTMANLLAGPRAAEAGDKAAARILLDAVISSFGGKAVPSAELAARRHYLSQFGDGLVPVLKELLGPDLPLSFLAHCVDGYWRLVRDGLRQD